jgi:hypothetical protein
MNFKAFVPAMFAAAMLALPAASEAGKHTYYQDRDHDGHFVKKTVDYDHHNHGRYYGGHYGGYGYPYGYGYGHGYGYGYRRPYWGYGYPYYGPSIGLSFYSRPTYYTSRVYRGSVADNSLAADVQRALRRQGYYYGSVDGIIGSGSRSAIRAYQRDRGLLITGRIDRALLRSLRIG